MDCVIDSKIIRSKSFSHTASFLLVYAFIMSFTNVFDEDSSVNSSSSLFAGLISDVRNVVLNDVLNDEAVASRTKQLRYVQS